MRADAVACGRIDPHRSGSRRIPHRFRTHLGTYQFIETCLAGTIQVDPGGFARILMLWQVLSDKQCGRIRAETYFQIHIRVNCCGMRPDALGSCHIKMLFRSSSSLLNRILYFVQWCPSKQERPLKMLACCLRRRASPGSSDVRARLRLKAAAWAWLWTAQAFETLRPSPSRG